MVTPVTIPLFPLRVVLFPESKLPLHIFEERYKKMIAGILEKDGIFGINFIDDGKIKAIGCTARIEEITERYPDGKLDIIVGGIHRYRLLEYYPHHNEYLLGSIEQLDDRFNTDGSPLYRQAVDLYNELVEKIYQGKYRADAGKLEREISSFFLAQKAGLPPHRRQVLLEMDSEHDRLEYLVEYLTDVLPKLENLEEMTRIIQTDGYLQNE